jgi:hypothetical protein
MNCPACERELSPLVVGRVTVDVCSGGCGGIWFDNFELTKFDQPNEVAGEVLLHIDRDPGVRVDFAKRRSCPKCRDVVMMRHFYSPRRKVEVDECPACGGYWLDAGELAEIRSEGGTEEQRREAAEKYFDALFEQEMVQLRSGAGGAGGGERVTRVIEVLSFVRPKSS